MGRSCAISYAPSRGQLRADLCSGCIRYRSPSSTNRSAPAGPANDLAAAVGMQKLFGFCHHRPFVHVPGVYTHNFSSVFQLPNRPDTNPFPSGTRMGSPNTQSSGFMGDVVCAGGRRDRPFSIKWEVRAFIRLLPFSTMPNFSICKF